MKELSLKGIAEHGWTTKGSQVHIRQIVQQFHVPNTSFSQGNRRKRGMVMGVEEYNWYIPYLTEVTILIIANLLIYIKEMDEVGSTKIIQNFNLEAIT